MNSDHLRDEQVFCNLLSFTRTTKIYEKTYYTSHPIPVASNHSNFTRIVTRELVRHPSRTIVSCLRAGILCATYWLWQSARITAANGSSAVGIFLSTMLDSPWRENDSARSPIRRYFDLSVISNIYIAVQWFNRRDSVLIQNRFRTMISFLEIFGRYYSL